MQTLLKYFPNLTPQQQDQFTNLQKAFLDWNEKINLISRKDTEHFEERHLLHALAIAKLVSFNPGAQILDVGTGGGIPGLPLAILFPETQFLLVDSIGKKIRAVQDMARQLNLTNVQAKQMRCEQVEDKFDFIISRAVAPVTKIHKWVGSKVKKQHNHELSNGYLLLKGGDLMEEIAESKLRAEQFPVQTWFKEPFYETKKVVYIPF